MSGDFGNDGDEPEDFEEQDFSEEDITSVADGVIEMFFGPAMDMIRDAVTNDVLNLLVRHRDGDETAEAELEAFQQDIQNALAQVDVGPVPEDLLDQAASHV